MCMVCVWYVCVQEHNTHHEQNTTYSQYTVIHVNVAYTYMYCTSCNIYIYIYAQCYPLSLHKFHLYTIHNVQQPQFHLELKLATAAHALYNVYNIYVHIPGQFQQCLWVPWQGRLKRIDHCILEAQGSCKVPVPFLLGTHLIAIQLLSVLPETS